MVPANKNKKMGLTDNFIDRVYSGPQITTVFEDLCGFHFFTKSEEELQGKILNLKSQLKPTGMLWISWPKKASKVPTDIDDGIVRSIGLKSGLVDVKVCAVDEVWSGLKFVFRLKDRP